MVKNMRMYSITAFFAIRRLPLSVIRLFLCNDKAQ